MKAAYIDSSCIVAIAFEEPGFKLLQRRLTRKINLFSHHLLEAEVLAAARRQGVAADKFSTLLSGVRLIFPDTSLTLELNKVFSLGYLRGADALHLATALWLAEENVGELSFFTLDRPQGDIAKRLGFPNG